MPTASFSRKTLYGVLGIENNASSDEVRRAYRKKALETHPDKLDPKASEEEKQVAEGHFHIVHEAFEILSDPSKRKTYDSRLQAATDPSLIFEEARRRVDARKEWAQLHRDSHEKRMAEYKSNLEREQRAREEAAAKKAKEAEMVAEMLKEMYQMNPEFAARRQAALQRKAERERAEMLKQSRSQQSVRP